MFMRIATMLLVYGGACFYIGWNGWQWIEALQIGVPLALYSSIIFFLSASYTVARLAKKWLPNGLSRLLTLIGALWMPITLYSFLLCLVVDLTFIFVDGTANNIRLIGTTAVGILLILLLFGVRNAYSSVVRHYDITLDKPLAEPLNVVVVSDIHLGTIIGRNRLAKMVREVNELKPDLILMAGDVLDEDLVPFVEEKMGEELQQLQAKHGVYAVTGNHEYYGGYADAFIPHLEAAGVTPLLDDYVKVNDEFYIIGRRDIGGERFMKRHRKELVDIIDGIDHSLPLLLIDHQPRYLEQATEARIDLQVSGHTHRGQMWPNHLITERMYEVDWGHLKKDVTHFIVSSGYGTWGPPFRLGTRSEIVQITVRGTAR